MKRRWIKRRRLEHSFAISNAVLVIVVLGATMALVGSRVDAVLIHGLEARATSIARSIGAVATPSLLAYNYAALQVAAEGAVEDPDLAYVVIHDKEGEVAGSAGLAAAPDVDLPPLPDASTEELTRGLRVTGEDKQTVRVFEAIVPVHVEGVRDPWGTVRVGLRYDHVDAELSRLKLGLALLGLILALLGVISSRWTARRIAAPLRKLAEGTEELSVGNIGHRISVTGALELAELAQAFNVMMDRVQEKVAESKAYEAELAELNATLEQQVRDRTRALEESETQYRTLVEHSPDSILIVQEGHVRFVNRAFEETFGIDERIVLAADFRLETLFNEGSAELVAGLLEAWQNGEATTPVMVRARDTAGSLHELEIRGSRIEYRGSVAAECLLVDMTEAKRLREELEDTERLRALGELSSGVAHDFNNLLGAILGRVQLLRKREFDHDIDRELTVIEKAARDGRETVRRIQEFSRTRADRPFAPVILPDILRDAVEITRTRWESDAQRRNITIQTIEDYGEVSPIYGNATELREVFTNLILNAVDAMPQGGEVRLRCHEADGKVHAEVEDSGVGMTEEIRRHLFDPFYTTKGMGGTGLGMSVAYGIVTRHQGTIDVTTALGQGTTFTLEFPPSDDEVARHGEVAETPMLERTGRILVIDDEPPIAELLGDALSGEGHTVVIAGSGREGVRKAQTTAFDLVLTDLGMPDMSGWEVVSRIHADAPEVPVVLVTGWGATISEEEAERGGVVAVVHKPFEIKDLLHTTSTILARGSGEPGDADGSASS